MRARFKLAAGALLIVAVGWTVWQLRRAPEPVYQGKPLSAWLAQLDDHTGDRAIEWSARSLIRLDENEKQLQAAAAIRQIGTNALPGLLRMVKVEDNGLGTMLRALVYRFPPLRPRFAGVQRSEADRHVTAVHIRHRGALGIIALGSAARPAVPQLTYLFTNSSPSAKEAALSLASLGPEGAAPLREALTNRTAWGSWNAVVAVWALAQFPTNGQVILEELAEGVTNKNLGFQLASVWALARIHTDPGNAVEILLPGLNDPNESVRRITLDALRSYGAEATSAVPALLERLETQDLRHEVLDTLHAIDPQAGPKIQ